MRREVNVRNTRPLENSFVIIRQIAHVRGDLDGGKYMRQPIYNPIRPAAGTGGKAGAPRPMISPLTLLTASLSPSTRPAISNANRFRPSSRTLSASSRLRASSISSRLSVVGPLSRKLRSTGLDTSVVEDMSACRYARSVSRFFSRASREGPCAEAKVGEYGELALGRESVLSRAVVLEREKGWGAEPLAVTADLSLRGGGLIVSSGCFLRS